MAELERVVQRELGDRVRAESDTAVVLPGVTAAIRLPGGEIVDFAAGRSNLENDSPMRVDHRIPVGSVGKLFVAALAMSLVSDDLLELDEPIARWLGDESWFTRLPNHRTLTLRNLLNHSGGLIDHVFDQESRFREWFARTTAESDGEQFANEAERDAVDRAFDPATLVRFALDREPLFQAGEGFHYTDTGYILVGLIIEKATGIDYYQLLRERLLEPLGLTLTFAQDRRGQPDLPQGYAVDSRDLLGLPTEILRDGRLVFNPLIEWTGGGVISNPRDLVRWVSALFESTILDPRSVEQMLTSIVDQDAGRDPVGRQLGYGLGVSIVETDVGTAYRHGGFFPGYVSMVAYFPDHRIAIAMQINSDGADLEAHFDAVRNVAFRSLGIID